jgi:hypothetical protein
MTPPRSTFVTVVAWVFIVISGFATFISAMQAMMFIFYFPAELFQEPKPLPPEFDDAPILIRLMMNYMQWFFVLFWTLILATLVSSIGLLLRKNWARLVFVGLMTIGIAWMLAGLVMQHWMTSQFSKPIPHAPPGAMDEMQTFAAVMYWGMLVFSVGMAVVFGWIAKRLLSRKIAAEFGQG